MNIIDDPRLISNREEFRSECETGLVGALLIEPSYVQGVQHLVGAHDFASPGYGELYAQIVSMSEANRTVTAETVCVVAKRNGTIDRMGGLHEYMRMTRELPNAALAIFHAHEVARLAACRRAENAAITFLRSLSERDCAPREAIERLIAHVKDLGVTTDEQSRPIAEIIGDIYAEGFLSADEFNKTRIATGYPSLDALIGGLYPETLVLLGGRFGSGKSAMAADLASRTATANKSVLMFSVEMTDREFAQRVLSMEAGVHMGAWQRPRTEEEQRQIANAREISQTWRWWIDDTARQTLSSIRASARLRKLSDGLDLLVIDNLTLIEGNQHEKKVDRYKATTEELKKLSGELECCVILLAQLNADAAGNEPNSTSWADCKSIEGDANVAMMLHRQGDSNDYNLIVTKNRSRGPTGKVSLIWDGPYQRFSEATVSAWG